MRNLKILALVISLLVPTAVLGAEGVAEYRGTFTQGALVIGWTDPGTKVTLDGRDISVGADGVFVFGLSRDHGPKATLVYSKPDGTVWNDTVDVASQAYDIDRVDGLSPSTVTIPEEIQIRRKRERAMVAEARAATTDAQDWRGGFIMPAEGRISGVYGSQRILNGEPRFPHYGLDIAAPVGTPIYAPAGGIVRLAEADFYLEGGIVIIDHGFGVNSTLFHMNAVHVAVGQRVEQGEQIGEIGQKGRASGPHVDWRINWTDVRLDPMLAVSWLAPDTNE